MKGIILAILFCTGSVACSDNSGARSPASSGERKPVPFKLVNTPVQTNCSMGPQESIEVCQGLNRIRSQNGQPPLTNDRHLTQVAMAYAREMYDNGKMTHGNFSERMKRAGVLNPVGENIAHGQRTPDQVLRTWSGSPAHFANMINPAFKIVGVGYYQGYWVQIFSGGQR